MKFTRYSDELWIASEQDYSDWKGFPVLGLTDMFDYDYEEDVEPDKRFIGTLSIISLTELPKNQIEDVKKSAGYDDDFIWDDLTLVAELYGYGNSALLKQFYAGSKYKLLRKMVYELVPTYRLIGFYLDQFKNRIGHTGWDYLRGDLSIETAIKNREQFAS